MRDIQSRHPLQADLSIANAWVGSDLPRIVPVSYHKDQDIVQQGARVDRIIRMTRGIAMRYRVTRSGERHIFTFLFPGDVCFANCFSSGFTDHAIGAVTDVRTEQVEHATMRLSLLTRPDVNGLLWEMADRQDAAMRDLIATLEHTHSSARVVLLLIALGRRLQDPSDNRAPVVIPIIQSVLADASGMSMIHFNRSVNKLVDLGLAQTRRGGIVIPDLARICTFASNVDLLN